MLSWVKHEKSLIISGPGPTKLQILECAAKSYFSYFSTKPNIVDAQKNHLIETVFLGIRKVCLVFEKEYNF